CCSTLRGGQEEIPDTAIKPHHKYHFHTGRLLAARLSHDARVVDALRDEAVESLAGAADPFSLRDLKAGGRVVDLGSAPASTASLPLIRYPQKGHVIGVDMIEEMLTKSRNTARAMGLSNVEFREGILEKLPVEDAWADVQISNGVINLCADKQHAFS